MSQSSTETVPITFILENPRELTDTDQDTWNVSGAPGSQLLDVALDSGIEVEHVCGGVCACSTCHVYIEEGMDSLSEADEEEEDRVEEAPGLQRNSRLSCQCQIIDQGPIVVRIPAWNRNAVKETPH